MDKKLLHIVRNNMKKESWQLIKKQKVIQRQKLLKILTLKIQKCAGIFKKPQNLYKKGT